VVGSGGCILLCWDLFWVECTKRLRHGDIHDFLLMLVRCVEVKRVDCVIVGSKLHISERSTAPYIVSTSQSPADRTTGRRSIGGRVPSQLPCLV
jgi:hypothetical protein